MVSVELFDESPISIISIIFEASLTQVLVSYLVKYFFSFWSVVGSYIVYCLPIYLSYLVNFVLILV